MTRHDLLITKNWVRTVFKTHFEVLKFSSGIDARKKLFLS